MIVESNVNSRIVEKLFSRPNSRIVRLRLCTFNLHPENRNIFLSAQDNTQNEIFVFKDFGFDAILQYIAGNWEIRENVKQIN